MPCKSFCFFRQIDTLATCISLLTLHCFVMFIVIYLWINVFFYKSTMCSLNRNTPFHTTFLFIVNQEMQKMWLLESRYNR